MELDYEYAGEIISMNRRLLLILNPASGKGAAANSLFSMVNGFSHTGWEVTVLPTQAKGDAEKIAQERAGEFPFLVCSGGDGTLNETVNGLMKCENRPLLGYIPAGTANDFAATLGIPHNPEEAALKIGDGRPFCYDVGDLNGKYFNYIAAFGIFTEVSYSTPQQFKNVCGRVAYFLEGMKQLSSIRHYPLKVEWENGSVEGDFIFGAVMNLSLIHIYHLYYIWKKGEKCYCIVKFPDSSQSIYNCFGNILLPKIISFLNKK